ncbi:porin (plasmid) [Paraburkholderia sp. PREW-6R]|uniref:porin n=1 Tax=Paraburkholderia sp. PREW-6R TaxID=3141544 RepID=UPI0031F4FB86
MKKMVAVAACGLFSQLAAAQSSVTLYGILSEGVQYLSNSGGHSLVRLASGTNQNTRWGLRGTEDLGGGLSAIFTLENGFDLTSGALQQGGRLFGRQAFVGLQSTTYGTFTMGRQYDFFWDNLLQFQQAAVLGDYGVHIGDNDNMFGGFRYNNTVKYVSPTWNGLTLAGMYGFSNNSDFSFNRMMAAGVTYNNGNFRFGAAFTNIDRPGTAATTSAVNPSGASADDYNALPFIPFHKGPNSMGTTVIGVDRQRNFGAGAAYNFGALTWSGVVTDVRYTYIDQTSLHLDNFDTSLRYRISPALFVGAGYVYTTGNYGGVSSNRSMHWNMVGVNTDYFLSKRTDVYVFADVVTASGPRAQAITWTASPSTSRSQIDVTAGIRHKF